jgi:SAM-dependent methyltransferase
MMPKLNADDLEAIANCTLEHYDRSAEAFWRGTRDHDVSQNIDALLRHIEGPAPYTLLDFGCGPGRDLKAFADRGHIAIGLEGSATFAAMAREYSGCEVWQQNFLEPELPPARFDGVFANASLFHVPTQALPRVLQALRATLKPAGVLFSSNPRGRDEEGWNHGRYGAFWDLETWRGYVSAAGFVELEHYYRPDGIPVDQRPWLATVWRAAG